MVGPLIELKEIHKLYQMDDKLVRTNDGISLTINYGEFVAIVDEPSSGKSTLVSITGALGAPTDRKCVLGGEDVSQMSDNQLAKIRNKTVGLISQQYNLFPKQSLLENVGLPLLYAGVSMAERRERALQFPEWVGLREKWKNLPDQLSGGRQRRVPIAGTSTGSPSLILADEPTNALDSRTSRGVLDFLKQLSSEGNTIVMITHDSSITMEANQVVRIHDEKVNFDGDIGEYGTVI